MPRAKSAPRPLNCRTHRSPPIATAATPKNFPLISFPRIAAGPGGVYVAYRKPIVPRTSIGLGWSQELIYFDGARWQGPVPIANSARVWLDRQHPGRRTFGGHFMGEEFTVAAPPAIAVKLRGSDKFVKVHIVKDGEYVYSIEPNTKSVDFTWKDGAAARGKTSYYYVRGEQANGELVWVSPIWITYQ